MFANKFQQLTVGTPDIWELVDVPTEYADFDVVIFFSPQEGRVRNSGSTFDVDGSNDQHVFYIAPDENGQVEANISATNLVGAVAGFNYDEITIVNENPIASKLPVPNDDSFHDIDVSSYIQGAETAQAFIVYYANTSGTVFGFGLPEVSTDDVSGYTKDKDSYFTVPVVNNKIRLLGGAPTDSAFYVIGYIKSGLTYIPKTDVPTTTEVYTTIDLSSVANPNDLVWFASMASFSTSSYIRELGSIVPQYTTKNKATQGVVQLDDNASFELNAHNVAVNWPVFKATPISATDTITPPATIKFGETVTVTNSGFASGAPNAGTIGGQAATVAGTSVTLPNIASVPDGTVVSDTGSQAISLTNGTESAASTITVDLPTGYIETAMTTVDAATNGTLGNLLLTVGYTLVTGDKIVIDAADGSTTNADSSYSWQLPKDFTVVRAADNTAYQYTLSVDEGITPAVPDLSPDVVDAEPNSDITKSFVVSGLSVSLVDIPATGDAQVSLSEDQGFTTTVSAGNGDTVWVRIKASPTFGATISGGAAGATFSVTTRTEQVPVLSNTKLISATVAQPFTSLLTRSGGDPATSWTITGGADAASYTLTNDGVLTRNSLQNSEVTETITVTATNAVGTSSIQTITINYKVAGGGGNSFTRVRSRTGVSSIVRVSISIS